MGWFVFGRRVAVSIRLVLSFTISGENTCVHSHSSTNFQILGELGKVKDCSLTHLAAKTGLTKACVQRDFEMYLQKMNLMEVTTSGRSLTKTGHDYLEKHDLCSK